VQPIALQFGGITIHWYGVMVALGFAAGLWTAARRAPLAGIRPDRILDLGPWLMLGAILGARLWFVVSYPGEFAGKPFYEVFMIQRGGLVYYGGLAGASLACILYCLGKKLPLWKAADILAPSVALGYVFGRLGCFFNGCCFGKACSLPWAVTYPVGHASHAERVHPSQIYDSLLSLTLYLGLAWLFRRRKFDGQVFGAYLVGYALLRSFIEMFRGDYPDYIAGWITPAHLVSAGILLVGLFLLVAGSRGWLKSKTPSV
jgi:phosphatidylglycerol:prolipoprotein diacylglycerol transferase